MYSEFQAGWKAKVSCHLSGSSLFICGEMDASGCEFPRLPPELSAHWWEKLQLSPLFSMVSFLGHL